MASLLAACGGGESSSAPIDTSALSSDLGITAIDFDEITGPIHQDDIVSEINDIDEFINKLPLNVGQDGEDSACGAKHLPQTFVDSQQGYFVYSSDNTDMSECYNSQRDNFFEDYHNSTYAEIALLDKFGNEVDLEGATPHSNKTTWKNSVFTHEFIQAEGGSSFSQLGGSFTFGYMFLTAATSDSTLPCVIDPHKMIKTDCSFRSRTVLTQEGEEEDIVVATLKFDDVKITTNANYFTEGRIHFTINDWQGVMHYHPSDPEQAPTYTVTNGEVTIEGTFGEMEDR